MSAQGPPAPAPPLVGSRLDSAPPLATPEQVSLALAAALTVGDRHLAARCFAREACLLTPDATVIRGRDQIRDILGQMIAMRLGLQVELRSILTVGEIALSSESWTTRFESAESAPLVQAFRSTAVLKRLDEGWKLLISAPWGWR